MGEVVAGRSDGAKALRGANIRRTMAERTDSNAMCFVQRGGLRTAHLPHDTAERCGPDHACFQDCKIAVLRVYHYALLNYSSKKRSRGKQLKLMYVDLNLF